MTAFRTIFLLIGPFFCWELLGSAETLRVQVLDSQTGAPIRATVNAAGTLPKIESARTNEQGVAVLDLPSLQHVTAVVKTSTHGEKCLSEEDFKEGAVVVRMQPSLRVGGVVRDPNGNPLRQATVKLVYEEGKCRIRFDRPEEMTNAQGQYVVRNVDLSKDPTIVIRHDVYAERAITKGEISTAPSGPSANTKELDINLVERY